MVSRISLLLAVAAFLGSHAVAAQPKSGAGSAGEAPAVESGPPASGDETTPARLSDEAELARVISLKDAGNFKQCAAALKKLLDPQSPQRLKDPDIVEQARLYHAHCLIADGRREEAKKPLRDAIRANPTMKTPDSLVFFPPVVDLFLQLREELDVEVEAAERRRIAAARKLAAREKRRREAQRRRLERIKQLAQEETIVVRNRRWLAAVPFGVGQFQNGSDALGATFLTSEILLGGSAMGSLIVLASLRDDAADPDVVKEELTSLDRTATTVLEISSYGFLGVAVLGIIEAQLSFVPERIEKRRRNLPQDLLQEDGENESARLRLTPALLPTPHGLGVSVLGQF